MRLPNVGIARVLPPMGIRRSLVGAMLWMAASLGAASGNSQPVLDQDIEALKRDFFALQHQRAREELAARYATAPHLDVYIAKEFDGWVIESAELSLNGEVIAQASYTPRQANALLGGGWHRLLRREIGSEEVVLEARLRGSLAGSDEGVDLTYSKVFAALDGRVEILLAVSKGERVVTSAERHASLPVSIVYYDPVAAPARVLQRQCRAPLPVEALPAEAAAEEWRSCLAIAQYFLEVGRSHQALFELDALPHHLGDERNWLLGRAYLQLGMRNAADTAFGGISRLNAHFAPAMLLLAQHDYERGMPGRAVERLTAHKDLVPDRLSRDWHDLLSRGLMDTGDPAQAVELLSRLRNRDMTPYMRYNLGVAQVRSGNPEAGIDALARVGRGRADKASQAALKDRALVVAAQHAMDLGHHARARALLRDVRLEGPYSSTGMLAMGWAHLKDAGVAVDASAPAEAALRTWGRLVERDQMDPAVQEAMVGIPYLLTLAQHHAEAHRAYHQAISALESAAELMDEGIASLHSRRLIDSLAATGDARAMGRDWRVEGLPDMPATYWLSVELSGSAFQHGLRNYRDLGLMIDRLNRWEGNEAQLLVEQMKGARERQAEALRSIGLRPLNARRAIISEHLARARLGVARIEEEAVFGVN